MPVPQPPATAGAPVDPVGAVAPGASRPAVPGTGASAVPGAGAATAAGVGAATGTGSVATGTALAQGPLWRHPLWTRTWREFGYLNLALLLAPFGFAYVVVTISFGVSVAVTVVGLFVAGYLVVGARGWGSMYRGMARGMLGVDVPAPVPFRRGRGFWRGLGSLLGDAAGWRALAFLLVAFPLAIVSFVLSWTFLAVGLAGVTHWFWYRWLPLQQTSDGTWHRGASFGEGYVIDTVPRQWILIVAGLVLLLLWQRVTTGMAHLYRLLTRALLGPTRSSQRVAHLEQTRGSAVLDADARLRRIERDLHDGTQARLVAVAMQVGDARERLSDPGAEPLDRDDALGLLDDAHGALKETLAELREIARGIHPPALDNGLGIALETLAARCAVPVTVDVDLPVQPAPEVETIAYFCVAELLTNVTRHSGASGAYVRAEVIAGSLRVRVRDDGHGGAGVALPGASGGTGLHGLSERVATVDGDLEISSPVGGPTVVTVHLPLSVAR
ncbi:MAG TPA: sensor histidine kinase [Cellulomonas sp.]